MDTNAFLKIKKILLILSLVLIFASSLLLSCGYWIKITNFLVFVAIGLEITKVSIFLEIPNKKWKEKLLLMIVGATLSATSIFTSAKQLQYLIDENSTITQQSILDFEAQKNFRNLLESRAELLKKDIENDIKTNFKTRAERLYKELSEIQTQISQIEVISPEKSSKSGYEGVSWILAAILDLIIITLSHLLQKRSPILQKKISILNREEKKESSPYQPPKTITRNKNSNITSQIKTLIRNGHPVKLLPLRKTLRTDMKKVSDALKELFNEGFLQKEGRSYTVAI